MKITRSLILLAGIVCCMSASAQTTSSQYKTGDGGTIAPQVILCPPTDSSRVAVACTLAGGSAPSGTVGSAFPTTVSPDSALATTLAPTYTNNTTQPLSLTPAGALRTDSSATTQPVSSGILATAANQTNGSQLATLSSPSQAAAGLYAKITSFGQLQTAPPPKAIFTDTFESLDTVKNWNTSGTNTPTAASGAAVLSLPATQSLSSVLTSKENIGPQIAPYIIYENITIGSQQTNPLVHRWFGPGAATSFAYATPISDGVGWEVDGTGALNAVIYISGVRYVVNSTNASLITPFGSWAPNMALYNNATPLTWPASGTATIGLEYSNGFANFKYADGAGTNFDVPVGTGVYVPAVTTVPLRVASISAPSGTVLATTYKLSAVAVGDTSGGTVTIASPTHGTYQQEVNSNAAALVNLPPLFVTGASTQTVAGNNILLATAGTTCTDTNGYSSIGATIIPTGTVSSGVVTFEQSDDPACTSPVVMQVYDSAAPATAPVTTISPATGVTRVMEGAIKHRYIRERISTVIGGGGSLQALTTLYAQPYSQSQVASALLAGTNLAGKVGIDQTTVASTNGVNIVPTATAGAGIAPVVSGSASSGVVLKASAGSLYDVYANCTAACWLMVFNSTTVPADGATTAGIASGNLQECVAIAANSQGSIIYTDIPEVFVTGISAAVSSTACATKTAATTGFIHGRVK